MTSYSKLQSTASACVAVALVGSATFLLVLLALRPFNLAGIVNITSPEVWLAAGLAVTAMAVHLATGARKFGTGGVRGVYRSGFER